MLRPSQVSQKWRNTLHPTHAKWELEAAFLCKWAIICAYFTRMAMKSDSFLGASWNHLFKGPPVKSVVIVLLLFQKKTSKQRSTRFRPCQLGWYSQWHSLNPVKQRRLPRHARQPDNVLNHLARVFIHLQGHFKDAVSYKIESCHRSLEIFLANCRKFANGWVKNISSYGFFGY